MRTAARLWMVLVRFGFRLLYNEFAWSYDLVSQVVSLGNWAQWQRVSLDFVPVNTQTRVLDLAHGTGNLQSDLHKRGIPSIGFDLSPAMNRITQAKANRLAFRPRLVRGRAQQLPFAPASFSAVVSTFPTEFIVMPETLREIYRLLRPQGRLVIIPAAALRGKGLVTRVIEWLYRITGQQSTPDEPGHELTHLFEEHGFIFESHVVELADSRVWVIVATHP